PQCALGGSFCRTPPLKPPFSPPTPAWVPLIPHPWSLCGAARMLGSTAKGGSIMNNKPKPARSSVERPGSAGELGRSSAERPGSAGELAVSLGERRYDLDWVRI